MTYKKYKSLRLKDYDYSQPGAYFITICTHKRKCFFGEIKNEKMVLTKTGIIAQNEVLEISKHFENVDVGEYIVMPNHMHMVIYMYDNFGGRQAMPPTKKPRLQDIVGSYKSAVTRETGKADEKNVFKWQRYFHDHIVRTDRALENISDYIRMNPVKWAEDIENELYISGITEKMRTNRAKKFYKNLTI